MACQVKANWQTLWIKGRGGGQVVSVLAFYSDYQSSNPAEAYIFFCKIVFEKNENKQKNRPGFKKLWINPLFDRQLLQFLI